MDADIQVLVENTLKQGKKTGSWVSGGLACVEAIELLYEPALPPHVIHNILCV